VVDPDGALIGFVAENRSGNGGFVVPASDVSRLVDALLASGSPKTSWLGVSTQPSGQGLVLVGIEAGSPAEQAGWRTGDLLVFLAGRALKSPSDLVQVLAGVNPGTEVAARILRDGELHEMPVTPGGR